MTTKISPITFNGAAKVDELDDSVVLFDEPLQIVGTNERQWNGTVYDLNTTDVSQWDGIITQNHDSKLTDVIGKAIGLTKNKQGIFIRGIKYATEINPVAVLAKNLLTHGFAPGFSCETLGPDPDENGIWKNHAVCGLSQVVHPNDKMAYAVVTNSLEEAEESGLDTSSLKNEVEKWKNELSITVNGGSGSGNFGHAGIPGHQGGSSSKGGSKESSSKSSSKKSEDSKKSAGKASAASAKCDDAQSKIYEVDLYRDEADLYFEKLDDISLDLEGAKEFLSESKISAAKSRLDTSYDKIESIKTSLKEDTNYDDETSHHIKQLDALAKEIATARKKLNTMAYYDYLGRKNLDFSVDLNYNKDMKEYDELGRTITNDGKGSGNFGHAGLQGGSSTTSKRLSRADKISDLKRKRDSLETWETMTGKSSEEAWKKYKKANDEYNKAVSEHKQLTSEEITRGQEKKRKQDTPGKKESMSLDKQSKKANEEAKAAFKEFSKSQSPDSREKYYKANRKAQETKQKLSQSLSEQALKDTQFQSDLKEHVEKGLGIKIKDLNMKSVRSTSGSDIGMYEIEGEVELSKKDLGLFGNIFQKAELNTDGRLSQNEDGSSFYGRISVSYTSRGGGINGQSGFNFSYYPDGSYEIKDRRGD